MENQVVQIAERIKGVPHRFGLRSYPSQLIGTIPA